MQDGVAFSAVFSKISSWHRSAETSGTMKEKNCTAADLTYVTISDCNILFWGTYTPVLHEGELPKKRIDGTWAASAFWR